MTIGKTLGRLIEEWAFANQSSKKAFYQKAGLARSTMGFVLKGDMRANDTILEKAAIVLGIDAEDLKAQRDAEEAGVEAPAPVEEVEEAPAEEAPVLEARIPFAPVEPPADLEAPLTLPTDRDQILVWLVQMVEQARHQSSAPWEAKVAGLTEELEIAHASEQELKNLLADRETTIREQSDEIVMWKQKLAEARDEIANLKANQTIGVSKSEEAAIASLFARRVGG